MTTKAPTARERARAEITAEILTVARRHLAEGGAASLSLRAVAREVGMVSSAVYRYFPSRDELLTRLIVDAYTAVADAAEAAGTAVDRGSSVRSWRTPSAGGRWPARTNTLVYGTRCRSARHHRTPSARPAVTLIFTSVSSTAWPPVAAEDASRRRAASQGLREHPVGRAGSSR
jgi:AcrR family transcriptional regulator